MLSVIAAVAAGVAAGDVARVRLAADGRTDYAIVIAAEASATDRFAAEELANHLQISTGAVFPIVTNAAPSGRRAIELGTQRAKRRIGVSRVASLREEESVYRVESDGTVSIVGRGATGNAYGVYSFLEREVGCRWYTMTGDNLVPKHPTLSVSVGEHAEKPAYEYRNVLCCDSGKADASSDLFLFRNRINQRGFGFDYCPDRRLIPALKLRLPELQPTCHSFFVYVPPEGKDGYFEKHPEYFTLYEGRRVKDKQLCFSNPELRRVVTENFIRHAKEKGGKGFLDLSARDMDGPLCWCDACRALERKFDSPGGPFFDYLLEEAPKIKAACPDIILHFLAYHRTTTQKPPKMDRPFPDNVAVVFAPLDDDFSKAIDHPNNAVSLGHLKEWCRLCRVWLWNYPTTYANGYQPYGGLARTARDLEVDFEVGARGTYIEHDVGRQMGASFYDLQLWMLLQAQRDPKADWKALRREFCDFYYAPVADEFIAYEDYLEKNREAATDYFDFQGRADAFLTAKELVRWQRHFDRMEAKAAERPEVVQRLHEARIGLDISTLVAWPKVKKLSDVGFTAESLHARVKDTWKKGVLRRYDRTDKMGKAWHKKHLVDTTEFADLDTKLFLATTDVKPLPKEFDGVPSDKIIQIVAQTTSKRVPRVKMDDAATGYARYELDGSANVFPFGTGVHDYGCGKTLLSRKIEKNEVVPDKFHFYKLGRCNLTSGSCIVWMGKSWRFDERLASAYSPWLAPDDKFDVYVSLKFVNGDCQRVYCDRVVLVGPTKDFSKQ